MKIGQSSPGLSSSKVLIQALHNAAGWSELCHDRVVPPESCEIRLGSSLRFNRVLFVSIDCGLSTVYHLFAYRMPKKLHGSCHNLIQFADPARTAQASKGCATTLMKSQRGWREG